METEYSFYHGYSDIFRLLLQSGADTQNCEGFRTSDLIRTIWGFHLDRQIIGYRDYPLENLRDFEQCVSMTNAALENGCDIYDTFSYNPSIPNALFEIFNDYASSLRKEEVLKYLLKIGYDMEQRCDNEETLFLHAVTALKPANIKCLNILIEKGANIHAIDAEGRSALHCAFLAPTWQRKDEKLSYWDGVVGDMFEDPQWVVACFDIDDERYAEGYEDLHYDLDPLTSYTSSDDALPDMPYQDYISTLDCSMDSSDKDFNHDLLLDIPNRDYISTMDCSMNSSNEDSDHDLLLDISNQEYILQTDSSLQGTFDPTHMGDECQVNASPYYHNIDHPVTNDLCAIATSSADDFRDGTLAERSADCADTSSRTEEHYASSNTTNDGSDHLKTDFRSRDSMLAEESNACADTSSSTNEHDAGSETMNNELICWNCKTRPLTEVLKKRLKFKLLTLLQAGCDPNGLDNKGESPDDFAERLGLWPQWEWALVNAEYVYNEGSSRWIKTQPETSVQWL